MVWRASEMVLRMAKANDIAPRKPVKQKHYCFEKNLHENRKNCMILPAKNNICWKFEEILGLRFKFNSHDRGYMFMALPIAAHIWK